MVCQPLLIGRWIAATIARTATGCVKEAGANRMTNPAFHDFGRRLYPAGLLFALCVATSPAAAQTVQEVKDAMEMMVGSAAICADYLARPEVLENTLQLGRDQFAKAGLSAAEAEAFMSETAQKAMAEPSNETQKQVACEIINIPALK